MTCDEIAPGSSVGNPDQQEDPVDKLNDVYGQRDFPVLCEVARLIDSGEDLHPRNRQIAATLGMDEADVQNAIRALTVRELVKPAGAWGGPIGVDGVSAEAYFLTGLHPDGDELVSQLVSALQQAAELTPDKDEKSKLRRLADQAGLVSRDTLAAVLAAVVTGSAG